MQGQLEYSSVGGRKHHKSKGKGKRHIRRHSRGKSGGNFLNTLAVPAGLLVLQKALHGSSKSHKNKRKFKRSYKRSRKSRK